MRFRCFSVLFLLLASCKSGTKAESSPESLIGQNRVTLIEQFGEPNVQYTESSGARVYIFRQFLRPDTEVDFTGHSKIRPIYKSPSVMPVLPEIYASMDSVGRDSYCELYFELDSKDIVTGVAKRGSACHQ